MTNSFKRAILGGSAAILLAMGTGACAAETSESDIETKAEQTSEAVKRAMSAENDEVQATPVKTAQADGHAGHDHDAEDHSGHDHGSAMPKRDLSDVKFVHTPAPEDHIVGTTDAPNTVIVYASVTCPHCSEWFTNVWPDFKAQQIDTGKTKMIFREIATPPQQVAAYGFVIANCAPEDQYMDHIVYQMVQQKTIFEKLQAGQGKEVYDDLGARAGLDSEEKIKACFENPAHIQRINTASMRLEAAGATGVPTFIINEKLYDDKNQSAAALGDAIANSAK